MIETTIGRALYSLSAASKFFKFKNLCENSNKISKFFFCLGTIYVKVLSKNVKNISLKSFTVTYVKVLHNKLVNK